MIGYVCVGTNDLAESAKFYDQLLAELGAKRDWEMERFVAWSAGESSPKFLLIKPADGQPATVGNGSMVSFRATSKEQVDAVYNKAISLGGKDEGAAGVRGEGFYAGYFRDLEGNKFCAFFMG